MQKYALGLLAAVGVATVALPTYAAVNPGAVVVPAVLAAPAPDATAVPGNPNIQPVWYDRWGRWHGYGYGYGYHHWHHWHRHGGLRIIIR